MRSVSTGLVLSFLLVGVARAATPTIAIMPLQNLTGGRNTIGAAFRETLTVDLRATPGVKVLERAAIDKILKEQDFDGSRNLEGVPGVRVGTLLGASHLVTGAYQRQGKELRVTVRLISVETGQIVGATKVDGELERLLELQDKVSAALLTSVGWKPQAGAPPVQPRKRPRIAVHSIERFGDAELEPDPVKKKAILKEVVAQSPQFDYAVNALAQLENRMAGYEAKSAAKYTEREQELLSAGKLRTVFPIMRTARRYHALLTACESASASKDDKELVAFHRFIALEGLKRTDEALAAGEQLMATMPDSQHFAEVETHIRAMAEKRRTMAKRKADYDKDLKEHLDDHAKKSSEEDRMNYDWSRCIAARWNRQYNQLMVDGCHAFAKSWSDSKLPAAIEHVQNARMFAILALGEMGNFADAKKELAEFRKLYPMGDEEIDKALAEWPTD
jgi:TolB-like protein